MNRENIKKYIWLLGVNLYISAFTIGGGYVIIPMIRKFFVQKKGYFSETELMDMAAVAQSAPGAIAVNLSVLAGNRIAGKIGAFISCIAAILPPILILSVISAFYSVIGENQMLRAVMRGMQAGVCALIADVVIDMSRALAGEKRPALLWMAAIAFVFSFFLQINVIIILLCCAAYCLITGPIRGRKRSGPHEDHI